MLGGVYRGHELIPTGDFSLPYHPCTASTFLQQQIFHHSLSQPQPASDLDIIAFPLTHLLTGKSQSKGLEKATRVVSQTKRIWSHCCYTCSSTYIRYILSSSSTHFSLPYFLFTRLWSLSCISGGHTIVGSPPKYAATELTAKTDVKGKK